MRRPAIGLLKVQRVWGAGLICAMSLTLALALLLGAPRSASGQHLHQRRAGMGMLLTPMSRPGPQPITTAPGAVAAHLPGFNGSEPSTMAPSTGVVLSVPSVSLQVAVTDYTDCSGTSPLTRATAVQYTCTPGAVLTLLGHNPGVFTPLLRTQTGDHVIYSDGGQKSTYEIRSAQRVSPDQASRAGQDGSFPHMILATCAAPDASSYWIFTAILIEGPGPQARHQDPGSGGAASAPPQGGGGQTTKPGDGARPTPQPSPSASPSPSAASSPLLPGGLPTPPPV